MKTSLPPASAALLAQLRTLANPAAAGAAARFGIQGKEILGIPIPVLRTIARRAGKDHGTAAGLWRSGVHEAKILAAYVDEPEWVTPRQMESWVRDFASWDICDQVCGNLFDRTLWAEQKAKDWAGRDEEFVKRAGFVLMASLAVHDKKASDRVFRQFLPLIEREAGDGRNFVRKGVNWALRQIGKRNPALKKEAIRTAERILRQEGKAAKWVASDALRELHRHKPPAPP